MGSYLNTPIREKCSDDHSGDLSYGSSSMQGWRANQEDAHNCQVDFDPDTDTSLFAVYDGHGGAEVAIYTARNLPSYLKSLHSYKCGELEEALREAFIGFDATLLEEDVIKQLKDIAGVELSEEDEEEEEVKNEAALLKEEATMPIETLMQRYNGGKAYNSVSYETKSNLCSNIYNNGSEAKITNGADEDKKRNENNLTQKTNDAKFEKNGENSMKVNHSKFDQESEPHCSKTITNDDHDDESEEEESESDDDNWNSDDNNSDDDDEEDDSDGFNISKLFRNEEEDGLEHLGCGETPGTDSGCTAVVALLRGQDLYVANAGDSRCVICRGQTAVDMSIDHKPEDDIEKNRIHRAGGKISADGRVNGGLNLSRAIGDHAYKQNKNIELRDQMITSLPDVKHITLNSDDRFMVLACDGIWNVLTSQEVVDFILKRIEMGETKLSNICEELFETCLAPDTSGDGTGCDNMTCIIVKFPAVLNVNKNQTKSNKRNCSEIADDTEIPPKRCRNDSLDSDT